MLEDAGRRASRRRTRAAATRATLIAAVAQAQRPDRRSAAAAVLARARRLPPPTTTSTQDRPEAQPALSTARKPSAERIGRSCTVCHRRSPRLTRTCSGPPRRSPEDEAPDRGLRRNGEIEQLDRAGTPSTPVDRCSLPRATAGVLPSASAVAATASRSARLTVLCGVHRSDPCKGLGGEDRAAEGPEVLGRERTARQRPHMGVDVGRREGHAASDLAGTTAAPTVAGRSPAPPSLRRARRRRSRCRRACRSCQGTRA